MLRAVLVLILTGISLKGHGICVDELSKPPIDSTAMQSVTQQEITTADVYLLLAQRPQLVTPNDHPSQVVLNLTARLENHKQPHTVEILVNPDTLKIERVIHVRLPTPIEKRLLLQQERLHARGHDDWHDNQPNRIRPVPPSMLHEDELSRPENDNNSIIATLPWNHKFYSNAKITLGSRQLGNVMKGNLNDQQAIEGLENMVSPGAPWSVTDAYTTGHPMERDNHPNRRWVVSIVRGNFYFVLFDVQPEHIQVVAARQSSLSNYQYFNQRLP